MGWEVLCLGRTGSGERYAAGETALATRVWRAGKLVWNERVRIVGGGALLDSAAGLGERPVCGTLLAASPETSDKLPAACPEPGPRAGEGGPAPPAGVRGEGPRGRAPVVAPTRREAGGGGPRGGGSRCLRRVT